MIVQLLPIRVRAILDHSLANLVASLKVDASRWRSLVVLLMPHAWWLSRDNLLIVQVVHCIAHHAVDGVEVLMSWLENLLRPFWADVNVVDARRWANDDWSALHLVVGAD